MLTIYDNTGNKRFETPINKGSKRVFQLMSDDYVTLKFSTVKPVYFKLGDYCDIPNFGRFELVEPYQPTRNSSTGGFDYELKLEAQHMKWRNKIMRYLPLTGGNECAFSLTATAEVHLQQVLQNVKALVNETTADGEKVINYGYLYNGKKDWEYNIDNTVDASAKTISYDSTNIIDALTAIAEEFDCEWWLNGNIICLGKCEQAGDYVDFEEGVNVSAMTRSDSSEDYVTRILVFGSERNISPRYRKDLVFDVKEVANGGNRISDTSRPLAGDYFSASLVAVSSSDKMTLQFTGTKTETVKSDSTSDVLFYTESKTLTDIKAGDWKLGLSTFKPRLTFTDRSGSVFEARVDIMVRGVRDGATEISADYTSTPYIHTLSTEITPSFDDQTLNLDSGLSSLSIVVKYYVRMSAGSSIKVNLSPSKESVVLANTLPTSKITGLTLELLDSDGNVTKTFYNCVFNPDFKDTLSERNWIQLPNGAVMSVGDKYRIANIIKNKVKSSYFTSRYSAYSNYSNVVTNGVVTNRLMLPESYGYPYIDFEDGLSMEQGVEDVVVFEDVYPRVICTITSVDTVDRKETVENDDGTTTDKTYTAFKIKDNFFTSAHPFDTDYINANATLQIKFEDGKKYEEGDDIPDGKVVGDYINPESGKLNGWTFEVQFTKDTDGSAIWEIVRDNTSYVPNDILRPEVGDTFVLIGFDISMIDDYYNDAAEQELLETAQKYVKKINVDASTYECTMMPDVMKDGLSLELGKRINLINEAYIETTVDEDGRRWGRKSRIIGFEICLDIPYDNPVYTVGEKPAYSRFGEIEDQIDALKFSMTKSGSNSYTSTSQSSSNTSGVYVIGQTDITPASDTNVFSSLRSKLEFASKKVSESINYLWTFVQGLRIGNYVESNDGAKIDANGDAEFNEVKIRKGTSIGNDLVVGGDTTIGGDLSADGDLGVGGEAIIRKGITIGSGYQAGVYGGRIWVDDDGKVHIETDYIEAREKIEAKEVEIQEETHVGGCQIISPAAMRCSRVLPMYNDASSVIAYKCFFTAEDEDGNQIYNQFDVGDLAKCETFNLQKQANGMVGNHYFWRKVLECGYVDKGDTDYDADYGREAYILLSNVTSEKASGSDVPLAGDRIVTVGNATNSERQNLIILAGYGTGSPYIYQYKGINTFALTKDNLKVAISPNGNLFTGRFVIENESEEIDVTDYIENNIYLEAYQLVLSNEMAAVPCDTDENPIGDLPSSNITIYKGKSVEVGWKLSLDAVGCVATIVNSTVYLSELTEKNATITITAKKADCPTLTKVMTVVKVKEGETGVSGDHAVEFAIEPDSPMVLADMDGNCDPTQLGCKVYMVIGNQSRIEVPLANSAAITPYAAGDNLLFFNGKLFVSRPVEVTVPTDLILRYVVTNQTYEKNEETGEITTTTTTEAERIYTDAIVTNSNMKSIIFKLYRGTTLLDVQTVIVTVDASAMKVTYDTRFEVTDKSIEAVAERTTANEKAITDIQIDAEGIHTALTKTSGTLLDLTSGAGRNLLLKSNVFGQWSYATDSTALPLRVEPIDNPNNATAFNIAKRTDATYEIFYFPIRPQLIKEGEKYTFTLNIDSNPLDETDSVEFYVVIANKNSSGALTKTAYFDKPVGDADSYFLTAHLEGIATGEENGSQVLIVGVTKSSLNIWANLWFWHPKLEIGDTATAYSEAPEDYSDTLYSSLEAKIEATAQSLTSDYKSEIGTSEKNITEKYESKITQTSNEITASVNQKLYGSDDESGEGGLKGEYKAAIALSAQGLTSTMTQNDEELGDSISEIKQTATEISLKVEELTGYENLVTGNLTGEGWSATGTDGVLGEATPSTNGYVIANDTSSAKYLRTALFNLKANTKYILSFNRSLFSSITNGLSFGIKYGNTETVLFTQSITTSSDENGTVRETYTFETGDAIIENAFVEFAHLGVNAAYGTVMTISEVMVEEGDYAHQFAEGKVGLLASGIDIMHKQIVITADNIRFQNNDGDTSMFIDENGHILASYINADELIVQHLIAGDEDGRHVEIDPTVQQVAIYDEDGVLGTALSGNTYNGGVDDIYKDATKGSANFATLTSGKCIQKGSFRSSGISGSKESLPTLYSAVWQCDAPVCLTFTAGKVVIVAHSAGYTEDTSSSSTDITKPVLQEQTLKSYAEVYVAFYLDVADDENFTQNVVSQLIWSRATAASSSQLVADSNNYHSAVTVNNIANSAASDSLMDLRSAKSQKKGYHRVRMEGYVKAKKDGSYASITWGSEYSGGANLAADYISEFYVSRYFANGFCLGISASQYVSVWKDSSNKMHLQAEESGYGLMLSDQGLKYKHHSGIWMKMPLLVWKGKLSYSSTASTPYTASAHVSYDGSNFKSVTRKTNSEDSTIASKHIHVVMAFPDAWTAMNLSLSNTIVNITGYGDSLMKGTLVAISSTSMTVEVSDDASANDGELLIEIYTIN